MKEFPSPWFFVAEYRVSGLEMRPGVWLITSCLLDDVAF